MTIWDNYTTCSKCGNRWIWDLLHWDCPKCGHCPQDDLDKEWEKVRGLHRKVKK